MAGKAPRENQTRRRHPAMLTGKGKPCGRWPVETGFRKRSHATKRLDLDPIGSRSGAEMSPLAHGLPQGPTYAAQARGRRRCVHQCGPFDKTWLMQRSQHQTPPKRQCGKPACRAHARYRAHASDMVENLKLLLREGGADWRAFGTAGSTQCCGGWPQRPWFEPIVVPA